MLQSDSMRESDTNRAKLKECQEALDRVFDNTLRRIYSGDVTLKAHIKQGTIISLTVGQEQRL